MADNAWNKHYGLPEPACILKWTWTSLRLYEAAASSCHRPIAEPVSVDNFDFHNTDGVLEARRKMLNGQWPGRGCEYCRDMEAAGGLSDRVMNNNYGMALLEERTPEEVKKDPRAIRVTPKILEVNFSNLCNQGCMYCFPHSSTKLEALFRREDADRIKRERGQQAVDKIKAQWKERDKKLQDRYQELKAKFWEWMKVNASNLSNYRVLGGEPFYQPELWENIEFFQNNPCPNTVLTIFTNFNVEINRFKKALDAFKDLVVNKHIKELHIVISTDSYGPEEEYVRHGSNMEKWDKNWDLLQEYHEYFCVSVLSTLCNLNIKSAIHIVRKFYSGKYVGKPFSVMHFNVAHGHPPLDFRIFPKGFWHADFDAIAAEMKDEQYKRQILGYKPYSDSLPYDPGMVKKLKRHLDRMDKLRGTNWKQTFPWLVEFDPDAYPRED